MALIQGLGRNTPIVYGSQATYAFSIKFAPTTLPAAGTITINGVTVTLTAIDVVSPMAVAMKIKATAIAGWTTGIDTYNLNTILTESTTYGATAKPAYPVLGTATNIIFYDIQYVAGVPCPSTIVDDIYIGGRTPCTLNLEQANVAATLILSQDSGSVDQITWSTPTASNLTYGSAVTLVAVNGGAATSYVLTSPANYAKIVVTGVGANSHVELNISR
jgi:hypothetical protein